MLPYTRRFEFQDRYHDSVIYFDGRPVYITRVHPDNPDSTNVILEYIPLPFRAGLSNDGLARTSALDPRWTEHPIHVGYCNDFTWTDTNGVNRKTAYFFTRIPVRRSRAGLHSEALSGPRNAGMSYTACLNHPGFVKMLQKEYYPIDVVRKELIGGKDFKVMAFSPHWAMERDELERWTLHYKGRSVASGHDLRNLVLPGKFGYLKEAISEMGLNAVVNG
jgi:hypothetical protein